MTLPEILDERHVSEAGALVRRYYTPVQGSKVPRTGTRFDDWGGGGDSSSNVNRIVADDLVAVSFLSVDIRGRAAIGLLETYADEVSGLLETIPADMDLWDADIDGLNSPDSPASELWALLRGWKYGSWHVGPTRASKIMARKRPRLIPIFDSVVRPVMGLKDSGGSWTAWHAALTDGSGLPERLEQIRREADAPQSISALRVMDIILWMYGKDQGLTNAEDDEVDESE